MADIVRQVSPADPPPSLLWDTLFFVPTDDPAEEGFGGRADWMLANEETDLTNVGGFQATDPIGTAIILQLSHHARCPDDVDPPDGSLDRRGWAGDTFDIDLDAGEGPLGWQGWREYTRVTADPSRLKAIELYAQMALRHMLQQGWVNRFDIKASLSDDRSILTVRVRAYGEMDQLITSRSVPIPIG
jgi:phage gp46-like protein